MNTMPKILISILLTAVLCSTIHAQQPEQLVTRLFFASENGCENIETFFKFTNEFKDDELIQFMIAKNFNVETTMPISVWGRDQGTVSLSQGESITYKNTYTSGQSIITGTVMYSSYNKNIHRPICGLTFYYDEAEYSCGSVIVMTGGNCMPLGGKGTEKDPYVFNMMKPQ